MSIEALNWAIKQRLAGTDSSGKFRRRPGEKAVLEKIAGFADENWESFPGQAYLAEVTEYSERAVRNFLKWLWKNGYFSIATRRYKNRAQTNVYTLHPDNKMRERLKEERKAFEFDAALSAGSNEGVELAPGSISTGTECQSEPELSAAYTKGFKELDTKEDTQDALAREGVHESAAPVGEKLGHSFGGMRPRRIAISGPLGIPDERFAEWTVYRNELEEWWCELHGVTMMAPNAGEGANVEWLFLNGFAVEEVKAFYKHLTTDPKESWRGTVNLGAMAKAEAIGKWKVMRKKSGNGNGASLPKRCEVCEPTGMVEVPGRGYQPCPTCRPGKGKGG